MDNTRIENVLKRSKADAILVSDPTAIYYLIGKRIYPGERFLALVLRRDQKPVLFLNNLFPFEEDEQVKVVRYNDGDNVSDLLCPYIGKDEVLGVDKMLVARFLLPMQQAKLAKEFIDGSIAVDKTRAVKDEHEKELMRKSSAINDAAMERFKKRVDIINRESARAKREHMKKLQSFMSAPPQQAVSSASELVEEIEDKPKKKPAKKAGKKKTTSKNKEDK